MRGNAGLLGLDARKIIRDSRNLHRVNTWSLLFF
jgi:hypothetical protein